MDDLDLLKQKWQSVEQELPKLSYGDIHQMLLKKILIYCEVDLFNKYW